LKQLQTGESKSFLNFAVINSVVVVCLFIIPGTTFGRGSSSFEVVVRFEARTNCNFKNCTQSEQAYSRG